jgi:predicted dehydrogenase
MALNLKDCDRMLAAAKAAKRQLLIAHCVRFFPENVYVRELVKSGKYGKVVAADFTRFIAPPKWSPKGADWFFDEKKSGGVLFDAHIHDADYMLGTFGRPESVSATFHRNASGFIDHTTATYRYHDALITSDSSFAVASSLVWDASGRVFFEKATVYFGPFYKNALTVYPENGKPFCPKLAKLSGYEAEIRYFLSQVESGREGDILTASDAHESVALLFTERKSAATGRTTRFL